MRKKILLAFLAVLSCCSLALGITACGNTEENGGEHEHTYETTVVAPTCTELGYTIHTCTICQHSYTDTYEKALGHSFTNYVPNGDATCEADGTKTATCDHDGCSVTDTIADEGSKLGHTYGEPVWSWNGYESATATFTCVNDGGHVESATATGDAITSVVTTAATCTAEGLKTYTATVTFNGVDYTDDKTETLAKLNHSFTNYASNNDATSEADGTKTAYCDYGCGATDTITDPGTMLGHTYGEPDWSWSADYSSAKATFTCQICTGNEHKQTVDATVTSVVTTAATCTAEGLKIHTATLSFGGKTYTDEKTETLAKLNHSFTNYASNNDATCEEDGTKTAFCDYGCGAKDTIADEGSKSGHNYGEPVWSWSADYTIATAKFTCANDSGHVESATATGDAIISVVITAATCTLDGLKTYTATVTFNGKTYTNEQTETLTMLGHDLVHHDAKEPTCTEVGCNEYDTCSRCDYTTYVVISAKGHTPGAWTTDVEATCTEDGSKHTTCSVCNEEVTQVIPKLNHSIIHHDAKAPTCTEAGWEAYDTCARCDYTTKVEIPATGHTESDWITGVEATCTTDGSKYIECTVCHAKLEEDTIAALGHDLVHHDAKAPTCTEIGWEAYDTCSRCDYTTYAELPAKGHTPTAAVEENRVEATCTTDGHYDSVVYCSVCHEELSRENKTIDALGHSFTNYVSNNDATTIADGTKTATCDHGCGETETVTDYGSMLGHVYDTKPAWSWSGYESATAEFTCLNCEEEHIESVTATVTSVITTPATCEKDGVRTYTATVTFNGQTYTDDKTETITATGHNYEVEWSWTGYTSATATFTCSNDNSHVEVLTATGEAITDEITTAATCTSDGVRTYTATVTFNGKDYTDTATETIAATGHGNWVDNVCGNCGYDAGGSKLLNMEYNDLTDTYSVNGLGTCAETDVVIPAVYNGKPVTAIADYAFRGTGLTSIIIPDSVQTIGESAFYSCISLASVTLGKGITSIKYSTFNECKALASIIIPDGVQTIGASAFHYCTALASVTIPESVTSIGGFAFSGCKKLEELVLPDSLTEVGNYAFQNCTTLKEVKIPAGLKATSTGMFQYSSSLEKVEMCEGLETIASATFTSCVALTSATIPESVTSIGSNAFRYCSSLTSITIPDSVQTIGNYAFNSCTKLTSVTLSNELTSIGDCAFQNCSSLTSITIPDDVQTLGNYAFSECSKLTSVTLSNILEAIGDYTFQNCSVLAGITIPDGVTSIGSYAFQNCSSIASINIPDGVTSIGDYAFQNCSSITSIVLPESIVTLGANVFEGCSAIEYTTYDYVDYKIHCLAIGSNLSAILAKVEIINPELTSFTVFGGTKIISDSAFQNCSTLTSITLPDGLVSIGKYAFSGCTGLADISIPATVTAIGDYAFQNCTALASIKIPDKVTSIGGYAFYGCTALASVTLSDAIAVIGGNAFENCSSLADVTLPESLTEVTYAMFKGCSSLSSITIHNRITTIGNSAFYNCSSLATVTIGNGLTSIGVSAFYDCSSLESINIPDGVQTIGNFAFYNCSSLISVNIPDGVQTLGTKTFYGCSSLESVTIGSGVTSIGDYVFNGCSSLTSITIPDGVQTLGSYVFRECTALKSATIGNGVTSIGDYVFYYCTSLESATIGNGVTSIGNYAFNGCTALKSINIPDGVQTIKSSAFRNCSSLTSITIPDGVTSLGTYVFYGCSSLESATIGSGVTSIGDYVFYYCTSLTSITIPDGVQTIGYEAFIGCTALKSAVIGNGVTSIGAEAFYNCSSLVSVTIGSDVTSIGSRAFSGCSNILEVYNLSSLNITAGSSSYGYAGYYALNVCTSEENRGTFTTDENGYVFYEFNGDAYLIDYTGSGTELSLPADKTYSIYKYAFQNCSSIESVVIPENVTAIGDYAFSGCGSLVSVTIGSGVNSIGNYAFGGCYKLVEVYNLSTLNITAGSSSYGNAGYYALNVCTSEENRGTFTTDENGYVFYEFNSNNYLVNYTGSETVLSLPADKTYSISKYAFYNCSSIESVVIPENVTAIGNYAFYNCNSLESVTIGNNVQTIGDYAFYNCNSLKSITIPDGITSISEYVFYGCTSLTSITIPNSVTSIGNYAFSGCGSLTSITIPSSVKSIGSYAFRGCSSIASITIPDKVTSIGYETFNGCSSLESVTIGSGVTSIGKYAFQNCRSLTSITIPDGVKTIVDYAFSGCSSLESVVIPDKVTSIGTYAFSGCSSLKSVTIGNNVQTIGNYVFNGCTALESVTIGNSVQTIGNYAFKDCSSLASITIPDSVTSIGTYAFNGCTALESITIGSGVTSIGDYAFENCSGLTSVYYKGDAEAWASLTIGTNNTCLTNATVYYYSETEPALNAEETAYDGNFWHYSEEGEIVVWKKEEV